MTESMLDVALSYAQDYGFAVFPLHSVVNGECSCGKKECSKQGKHPRIYGGWEKASKDPATIKRWWKKWPDANIAISCKQSSLVVVDVDPRNGGHDTLEELQRSNGKLPDTVCQITGGGGAHYLYRRPEVLSARGTTIPGGIDIEADGAYIVAAPSSHISGTNYSWDYAPGEIEVAKVPVWIENILRRPQENKRSSGASPLDGFLGASFEAAGWAGKEVKGGKMLVKCPWEHEHTSGSRYDGATVVFAPNDGHNSGWFWCAHHHCQHRTFHDVIQMLPQPAREKAREKLGLKRQEDVRDDAVTVNKEMEGEWVNFLVTKSNGIITPEAGNASILLANMSEWAGSLSLDEFSGKIRWVRPVPIIEGMDRPIVGAEIQESDVVYLCQWFYLNKRIRFKKEAMWDAVRSAARKKKVHPVREWMESLEWDKTPRLSRWLSEYGGAEDSEYCRFVARAWVISAVARIMQPGCQADHTLILSGPQGVGKSSLVIALGGEYTLESMPKKLSSKDSLIAIRGKWIAVFNELEGLRTVQTEEVKDFLVRRIESYREPYGKNNIDVPRQCVFAGTSNDRMCLPIDGSGHRRFWPVWLPKMIPRANIERLKNDRNQIVAEAVYAYNQGEPWYPTTESQNLMLSEHQQAAVEEDPWESTVVEFLEAQRSKWPFSMFNLLYHALHIPRDQFTLSHAHRVSHIIRRAGFTSRQVRLHTGQRVRMYWDNWDAIDLSEFADEMYKQEHPFVGAKLAQGSIGPVGVA